MLHLKQIRYMGKTQGPEEYPFNIPLIKSMEELYFEAPVTIIVGENGSGKSTLMESLACAIGSITLGGESSEDEDGLEAARRLGKELRLSWTRRTTKGFFLRAEDFINYTKKLSRIKREMARDLSEVDELYSNSSQYARNLTKLPYARSLYEMKNRYDGELGEKSHGEGFLELFRARLVPGGLYLMDEPETPLSPMNQYVFMGMIYEMINQNCQFIIATHSPIIMAFPEADIYEVSSGRFTRVNYDELEAVRFTKAFLNDPERFIGYLKG